MKLVLAFALVVAGCETTAASPNAPTTPAPVTPSASIAAPAPSATPTASATSACLMTHICSCNMGCAKVAVDPATLHDGMHVTAQSGTYAGKDMIVTKDTDANGASVFSLSDRPPNYPCQLTPESKSLMGFLCSAKDSGPVPANACAKGCD